MHTEERSKVHRNNDRPHFAAKIIQVKRYNGVFVREETPGWISGDQNYLRTQLYTVEKRMLFEKAGENYYLASVSIKDQLER